MAVPGDAGSALAGPADDRESGSVETATPDSARPSALKLEVVARYTIPIHLVLPWALWGLAVLHPAAPVWFFLSVHVLFPVVLVVTYRYWRGQGAELALLVGVNHVATLLSGAVASWVASLV